MGVARRALIAGLAAGTATAFAGLEANAATARDLERDADAALRRLVDSNATAKLLADRAKGVLVFPSVIKAGFVIAGLQGNGTLRERDRTVGFYTIFAASYGFQAGAQEFKYALFFMNDKALRYLRDSNGFQVGVGPSVVVLDQGAAQSVTSSTTFQDVYAFIYGQQGLMAGVGIEGSKITQYTPDP